MSWLARFSLIFLLMASPGFAAIRNVKGSCANNGDGTTSACAGSPGGVGAFNTIAHCTAAMTGGDTCTVFAGTYAETPSIPAGTGSGTYNILTVNASDVVHILGATMANHTKLVGNCPSPSTSGTCGFDIENSGSPTTACVSIPSSSSDVFVVSNFMAVCGGLNEGTGGASDSIYIQKNTITYPDTTIGGTDVGPAITIYGNHELIENNDLSHNSDAFHFAGSHNIVRNNNFHDTLTSECTVSGHGGNCHVDYIETEPVLTSQFNVYEGNSQVNVHGAGGTNAHGFLVQADICGGNCSNTIIRFNWGSNVDGGGILDDNAGSSNPGYTFIKSYNNSWVNYVSASSNQPFGSQNTFSHNSTNGGEINDLFYYPETLSDFNAYSTDASTVGSFSVGNNEAFCTTDGVNLASPCNIHNKVYGSGTFTTDSGNIVSNPLFVNYSGNDFHLLVSSPALSGGTNLTTVAAGDSGSGTSLIVNDASYFQDGYTLTGVQADCISITTVGNHVCITAVNYSTNTLTMASSFSRSNGDKVWLYSDSTGTVRLTATAPNIGAFGTGINGVAGCTLSSGAKITGAVTCQ
jgi:hypothetical protein